MTLCVRAVIVVYGRSPAASSSVQSLLQCARQGCALQIVIWDNSPTCQGDDLKAHGIDAEYVWTPENLRLSVIYNRLIREHLRAGEHLLLLDDDTELPENFLTSCHAAVEAHPEIDLFLPMVRANNRWASPLTYACGWGRAWVSPRRGVMPSRQICAINSGMLISSRYLLSDFPGYDERLRFYGTDTQFMLDYMDRRASLLVLDVNLGHDLSFFSGPPSGRARKFAAMRSAYRWIYANRPVWQRLAVWCVMMLVSVRYAMKFRDPDFLRAEES